jgi:Tol biopolymer transport system component
MKRGYSLALAMVFVLAAGISCVLGQDSGPPAAESPYLGQKPPGLEPEIFSPDVVSVGEGVHGNIVFSPDFSVAAWSPNYHVDDRNVLLTMEYSGDRWRTPEAFYRRGEGFSHGEPFFSHDGRRLYFLSGEINGSKTENEKIYYVERTGEGWSQPTLLTPVLDSFNLHWQFSLDGKGNLYFGGKSKSDESAEIYFCEYRDGEYLSPVKLSGNINTAVAEFSPFVSPVDDYLVFTRLTPQQGAPPSMNLFVSFRDESGDWQEAGNLTGHIELPEERPFTLMSQARVTPDGRYLFFTFFDGKGHMVYWMDAGIIEKARSQTDSIRSR